MCCKRRKQAKEQRENAGKCRSMEIDGGPPPFCSTVDDDDDTNPFEKSPFEDVDDDDESLPNSSNLPLPIDRSRSVTPNRDVLQDEKSQERGDTNASEPEVEKSVEDEQDEWGDFGEAVAAPASVQNSRPAVPPLQMDNNDDDDDWGEFDQARPSVDRFSEEASNPSSARSQDISQEARQLAHQQSLEEWGAFEENQKVSNEFDDEWQAEFASAPPPAAVTMENLKFLEEMLEDITFWNDGFVEESSHENSTPIDVFDIPMLFDSESAEEMSKALQDPAKQKYSQLWLAIRVIEEAISLKFDWNKSEIQKNHLKSLKINPITIKKETRTTAAVFDTTSLLLPTSVLHPTSSSNSEPNDSKTSTSSPLGDVPAVDFDWDTSGLTNPMNRANQSSAIIDVDFLGSNGVATAYTSTLQKDLEQFGLNGVSVSHTNGSTILETLMSRANGHSSELYRTPEVLSLDAQKLLEKLPDLQYLQSKVLMFPVGTNLPH